MEQYQARVSDHCQTGKDCCALGILEAQDDFQNEVSLLETVVLYYISLFDISAVVRITSSSRYTPSECFDKVRPWFEA